MEKQILLTIKFIGTNSLGYEHNRIYAIFVWLHENKIFIKRIDGTGLCIYGSTKRFSENWKHKNIERKLKLSKLKTLNI